jgi:hypothetical protein
MSRQAKSHKYSPSAGAQESGFMAASIMATMGLASLGCQAL